MLGLLHLDEGVFVPIMIFALPIVAVVGGITAGIVRILARQRTIELAQRERIAAIERGIDPSKLPPGPAIMDEGWGSRWSSGGSRNRAQGLLVGGIITLFAGVGIGMFLFFISGSENVWAVGLIPGFVGIAMLLSSWIVWPRGDASPPQGGAGH
jgi:hypothetical protein